ncbi:MAG: DUF4982 domain-containing protein [Bacteroides sp.]|nr:DUF4982 domain-containing protein [Eubacterium sp.]MCM1418959.1 DUF4982 domain-containing protein [Roseburia sp.]MCM1463105.1 DUF4982 domain-containing protein [Bacteroides sp.]
MKKTLFNDNWFYGEFPVGTPEGFVPDRAALKPVELPHDMLIHDSYNFYKSCVGVYVKDFTLAEPLADGEKRLLRFDGVYPECRVFLNGAEISHHKYGYSAFYADMTPALIPGKNTLRVWVNHLAPNSRWYSGAGIYRKVELCALPPVHFLPEGIYLHTGKKDDGYEISARLEYTRTPGYRYRCMIFDPSGEPIMSRAVDTDDPTDLEGFSVTLPPPRVKLWDLDAPKLYTLVAEIMKGDETIDREEVRFGLRDFRFDPNEGFFLNGRHIKLNGVCLHHDLGSLGAAFHTDALRRQLLLLKEMGVNAIRTSHNMPAEELMTLADELGFLVVSEAFDMWGKAKTEYDYARFFNEDCENVVESWVRRDRNHPSLLMWSIGNEIYDTHDGEYGRAEMRRLIAAVRRFDPLGNAAVTFGSNYIPWENTQKCAEELDVVGGNYVEAIYDELHAKHPDWCIYGSETAARGTSRSIYHFPLAHTARTYPDLQMSSLENSRSGAGDRTLQDAIVWDRDCPFSAGQFIWTGFDYLGEPTPYSTKNSYYGPFDTAGFRKDAFYLYRAAWTGETVLHLFPYWDFNEGQEIDVCAYTNAPETELFINGRSLGRRSVDPLRGKTYRCDWRLPFEKGELRAVAYDAAGNKIAEDVRRSFGDGVKLRLDPDRATLPADGESLLFITVSLLDEDGIYVTNARNRVHVTVSGAGRLVGLDSGDSTDYESFKGTTKKLFGGMLLAVIAAKTELGEIRVLVESEGLPSAELLIPAVPAPVRAGVSAIAENSAEYDRIREEGIPIRKIALKVDGERRLHQNKTTATVRAEIYPRGAKGEIAFSAVTDSGIVTNIAEVVPAPDGWSAEVRALGDGAFRLRCTAANGKDHAEVISDLEFRVSGLGSATLDPYSFVSATFYGRTNHGELDEVLGGGVRCVKNAETRICFDHVDFGRDYADEITVPILRWFRDDAMEVEIWEKMPGEEGAERLWAGEYERPFIWQTYQDLVCPLSRRLTGETSICIVCRCGDDDVNVRGFSFRRRPRGYEPLTGDSLERVYGDSFTRVGSEVRGIGNNVTLDFGRLGFERGFTRVTLRGNTANETDSIHLLLGGETGVTRHIMEFKRTEGVSEQTFAIAVEPGEYDTRLMFLPGCNFDFCSIQFITAE